MPDLINPLRCGAQLSGFKPEAYPLQRHIRVRIAKRPRQIRGSKDRNAAAGRLASIFLAEFIDASAAVHDLLLAGVEGMAIRTHFDLQVMTQRRTGLKAVPARAGHRCVFVFGMNCSFHGLEPSLEVGKTGRAV
jgi:hypothetical protein